MLGVLVLAFAALSSLTAGAAGYADGHCANWMEIAVADNPSASREACTRIDRESDSVGVFDARRGLCMVCMIEDWTPAGTHGAAGTRDRALLQSLLGAWDFGRVRSRASAQPEYLCTLLLSDVFVRDRGYRIRSCNENESFWTLGGGEIAIMNGQGRVTTRLRQTARDPDLWTGPFVGDASLGIEHYLHRR